MLWSSSSSISHNVLGVIQVYLQWTRAWKSHSLPKIPEFFWLCARAQIAQLPSTGSEQLATSGTALLAVWFLGWPT